MYQVFVIKWLILRHHMRMGTLFLIVLALIALPLTWLISCYNQVVKLRNLMEDAWSGIEVQLKRRHELIPALVQIAERYAQHEADVLMNIVHARQKGDQDRAQAQKDEQALSGHLRQLFAQAEAHPDLKANHQFLHIQQQMVAVEHDLQLARRYFNGTVRNHNTLIQSFPTLIVAKHLNIRSAEFFEFEPDSVE